MATIRDRSWARRIGAAAAAAALTVSALVALPASPAAANPANLNDCRAVATPNYVDPSPWRVRGNYIETWSAPSGIYSYDALRVTGTGTTRIDHWGANKSVAGDTSLAPAGWPLPGERKYMLIGRVTSGYIWSDLRDRYYEANEWFPVGADSSCLGIVYFEGDPRPRLQLSINDNNLGDNGGGPYVTIKQWW